MSRTRKPDDHNSGRSRAATPARDATDILSRCLAIIKPAVSKLELCCKDINCIIERLSETAAEYAGPCRRDSKNLRKGGSKQLREFANALRKVGIVMQRESWLYSLTLPEETLWEQALRMDAGDDDDRTHRARQEWLRVSSYILAVADAAEGEAVISRPVNPP
jgi:hypothetical protein